MRKHMIVVFSSLVVVLGLVGVGIHPHLAHAASKSPKASRRYATVYIGSVSNPTTLYGSNNDTVEVRVGSDLFKLVMQSDGNLVLYDNNTVLWANNKVGFGGSSTTYWLNLQPDGNVVEYCHSPNSPSVCYATNHAIWSTSTDGYGTPLSLSITVSNHNDAWWQVTNNGSNTKFSCYSSSICDGF